MSLEYGKDGHRLARHLIHDPIVTQENFANVGFSEFRYDSPGLRYRRGFNRPASKAGDPLPCRVSGPAR